MRQLAYLAVIGMAISGAVLGPLAFSARTKEQPAAAATGELVYRSGSYSVRLTDAPCDQPELVGHLESEGIPPAKIAVVTAGQQRYHECWVMDIGGDVMTLDLAGQQGTIPIDWLRRE